MISDRLDTSSPQGRKAPEAPGSDEGVGDAHRDGDGQQPVVGDGGLRDVPRGAGAGEQGMQGCQGEVDSSCSIKALVDGRNPLAGPSHVPCRVVW